MHVGRCSTRRTRVPCERSTPTIDEGRSPNLIRVVATQLADYRTIALRFWPKSWQKEKVAHPRFARGPTRFSLLALLCRCSTHVNHTFPVTSHPIDLATAFPPNTYSLQIFFSLICHCLQLSRHCQSPHTRPEKPVGTYTIELCNGA